MTAAKKMILVGVLVCGLLAVLVCLTFRSITVSSRRIDCLETQVYTLNDELENPHSRHNEWIVTLEVRIADLEHTLRMRSADLKREVRIADLEPEMRFADRGLEKRIEDLELEMRIADQEQEKRTTHLERDLERDLKMRIMNLEMRINDLDLQRALRR